MAARTRTTKCCPNCGCVDIQRRVGHESHARLRRDDPDKRWYCRKCEQAFDRTEQTEIPDLSERDYDSPHVKALLDADPDDVLGGESA